MKVLLQLLRRPPAELAVLDEETQRRFPDLIVKCLIKQTKNLHRAVHVSPRILGWFCTLCCSEVQPINISMLLSAGHQECAGGGDVHACTTSWTSRSPTA